MTPIYQTSTYAQESPGKHRGYEYSRTDNPTRTAYQECLAALEGGKHALAFASGLATTATIIQTLQPGDHVVCCDDVYGGTFRIFDKVFRPQGIDFTFVDLSDLKKAEAAFTPKTKLVWMETPTNPMLKILDIAALCRLAHQKGAKAIVVCNPSNPCGKVFSRGELQEILELADIGRLPVQKPYDAERDVIIYGDFTAASQLRLAAGEAARCMPFGL